MADTVRYLMEEMVPELEDFVARRYFSRAEVKAIVARRTDFEYLLKRPAPLKEDFMRYIEYESKLEELRLHRRKGMDLTGQKKTIADYAIVRRIHFVFERAVRRFRSDVGLWTAWLEFCRASNSNRRLGRVVGRALQVHPTEPGLWVYAAAWEFESNANPSAARALMQQGLRMCKHSEQMWLDYFDMELMYVEKLVARRRLLGLDVPQPDHGSIQQQQEQQQQQEAEGKQQKQATTTRATRSRRGVGDSADAEQVAAQNEVDTSCADDGEGPAVEDGQAGGEAQGPGSLLLTGGMEQQEQQQQDPQDPQAAVRAVLLGHVARLVFHSALAAATKARARDGGSGSGSFLRRRGEARSLGTATRGSLLAFCGRFLRVLSRYSSPGVPALRHEVLETVRRNFPQDPEAADLLARAACDPTDTTVSTEQLACAVEEYESVLRSTAGGTQEQQQQQGPKRGTKRRSPGHPAQVAGEAAPPVCAPAAAVVSGTAKSAHGLAQGYRLYCSYLSERLEALLQAGSDAVDAAASAAAALFSVMRRAHAAGAADTQLYSEWVSLARRLGQPKVALKAARLACDSHPADVGAWCERLELEAAAAAARVGSNSSHSSNHSSPAGTTALLELAQQALRAVPAAESGPLWQMALAGCAGDAAGLERLAALLLDTVTACAAHGPPRGGLGAAAGLVLCETWEVRGPDAARSIWRRLLLLPPSGGDAFRAMVLLESGMPVAEARARLLAPAAGNSRAACLQQQQQQLDAAALPRARAVFDAWVDAYGATDPELWVEYAALEQSAGRAGAGRVYWRAVKALDAPEEFVDAYRAVIGAD